MVIKRNSAEGGTNTVQVTQGSGGNTGGASGDYFTTLAANGGVFAFSSTTPHAGLMGYRVVPVTGTQCMAMTSDADSDSMLMSAYFKFSALPSATSVYMALRSASVQAAALQVQTTGRIAVVNAPGAALSTSSVTEIITINTWYRFELRAVKGTTTGNGSIAAAFYLGDSTTPIWSYSSTAVDAGTLQLNSSRLGRSSLVADTTEFYLDSVQWWTSTDTPATLGNPWDLQKITGLTLTKTNATTVSVAWNHPTDAPDGVSIIRAPGTHTNDASARPPSDPLYDPTGISGAIVVATGLTASPYANTGMTAGTYTYWVVRDAP